MNDECFDEDLTLKKRRGEKREGRSIRYSSTGKDVTAVRVKVMFDGFS